MVEFEKHLAHYDCGSWDFMQCLESEFADVSMETWGIIFAFSLKWVAWWRGLPGAIIYGAWIFLMYRSSKNFAL